MTEEVKGVTAAVDSYASMGEFCSYFLREMESLHQLAYLLTGSHASAEESLLAALEDCKRAKVFRPWLESWSRLAVIERSLKATNVIGRDATDTPMELRAILQLNGFERVVYTLSVLENYSVRDCAILLRGSKRAISDAKLRALKEVSTFLASASVAQEHAVTLRA